MPTKVMHVLYSSNRVAVFAMTSVFMLIVARICWAGGSTGAMADLLAGRLQWTASEPLVVPAERPDDPCYSIKDPSVVFYQGRLHLFFTTLDGRMWREETSLEDFPTGWSEATLAIKGDIFEASHTYRINGANRYLTIVEAQGGHGWRYFKAYLADGLVGINLSKGF